MNFWEADIIKNQKVIKEMEENPGLRLKSYKIFLEWMIKLRRKQIEDLRQGGRPMIDMDPLAPCFFRAMGFKTYDRGNASAQIDGGCSGEKSPFAYKEKARAMGLPADNACDQTYTHAGMVAAGDMPVEPLTICTQSSCPPRAFQKIFIGAGGYEWLKTPLFYIDTPYEESEAALEYLVNQFREFIEVAEKKWPGVIKYDEAKLIEYQARTEAAHAYYNEIYEMLKHQPSPIAGDDVFEGTTWGFRKPKYARAKRDEVAERLAQGIAAVPGEKLRLLWSGDHIRFFDAFKVLAQRQIAVIFRFAPEAMVYMCPWTKPAYYGGRKLTPLEEEAAWVLTRLRGGTAVHWVDNMIRICRDLKIDAIINGQQLGATCVNGFKRLIADRAEKELGIPTLQLELKRWDPNYVDQATLTAKLDEFAQMLLSQKGLA